MQSELQHARFLTSLFVCMWLGEMCAAASLSTGIWLWKKNVVCLVNKWKNECVHSCGVDVIGDKMTVTNKQDTVCVCVCLC